MNFTTLFIFSLTVALSFSFGRMAGKNSAVKVESSIHEVLESLSLVQEVEELNQPVKSPQFPESYMGVDPNL